MPAFVDILRPLIDRRYAFDGPVHKVENPVDHMRGNAEFPGRGGGEGAPEIMDTSVGDTRGLVEGFPGLGKAADRCRSGRCEHKGAVLKTWQTGDMGKGLIAQMNDMLLGNLGA